LSMSITSDFWGKEKAKGAAEEFERVFKKKELPAEIEAIEIEVKEKAGLKSKTEDKTKAEVEVTVITLMDLLVERNIFPSRKEAKRVIRQGGVYLDDQRIEDVAFKIDLSKKSDLILKIGKRKFYRIVKKKA